MRRLPPHRALPSASPYLVRAAARQLPDRTLVVPVPLPPQDGPDDELRARAVVAAAYGATHLLTDSGPAATESRDRSISIRL